MQKQKKALATVLLITFIFFEYIYRQNIDSINNYASYLLELLFIFIVHLCLKETDNNIALKPIKLSITLALCAILGLGFHSVASLTGLIIPFNFTTLETTIFLLIVGPILEELLFRGAVWTMLRTFNLSLKLTAIISALLFSLSHLTSIQYTPSEFHNFILYQSFYTIILGLICGYIKSTNTVSLSIFAHFLFNFGFWIYTKI